MGLNNFAPLAQLDRVFGYGPKGWGFEPLAVHQTTQNTRFRVVFFVRLPVKK